ncbi:MAG: transketolase [Marinilabiliales bacterium]|nr:MAG: transketolase [Marinilabiliales bacterium]
MSNADSGKLKEIAFNIRKEVLKSLHQAQSGHLGGSLGLADIFTVLYFHFLNHKPKNPSWPERDRLILSIGHVVPVQYASLALAGYFPKEELYTLRKLGSRLQGHPGKSHGLPGIELSSGSLGQGLSIAVGMAIAAKADKKAHRIVSIHGDGELQEGSIWEAAMSASHYKLDNIIAIVDRNHKQIDGDTKSVMQIEPLTDKWKAFGWNVLMCDGNSIEDIIITLQNADKCKDKPSVVIAETKMSKGIKEIEDNHQWHGKVPGDDEIEKFIHALTK